jgi:tRNA dimethylallyltransferase
MSGPKRAVLIAGPTASGKSALAMRLAERLNGVVVNADSMQVYRDLRIITARPSKQEEARLPHRLYGHVDASVNYSVGAWCYDVKSVLEQAEQYGRVPILVGGTGLYFTILTKGLAAVPAIPPEIRERVRGKLAREGVAPLYQELLERDPAAAHRLMPNDRSRISRALEVVLATGRSLADWHHEGMPPLIDASHAAKVFITCEREELKNRIAARFSGMLAAGALEEVRALAERNLDPTLPAMKAHGVPWLIRHLRGEITLRDAAAGGVTDTRRYAKRQVTWFKNQLPDWPWVPAEEGEAEIIRQVEPLGA